MAKTIFKVIIGYIKQPLEKREVIMRKSVFILSILFVGMFFITTSFAQETFDIDVTIPASTSASFVVWYLVDGDPFPEDPQLTTDLAFTTTLVTSAGGDSAFLGDQFYAIDVSPDAAGQLNVLIEYFDTANPNGGVDDGLATKAIATVVKSKADTTEDVLEREVLRDIHNTTILAADLEADPPGFMRMYVGLATGDPTATPPEPAAAVPFNPGDEPGPYSGYIQLTVSVP